MRSRHLVLAVISLLSFYGCGGSSPGNRDAADGSVDTNKDTPSDKATDGAGGAGADAKDAPDVADVPKVDASTDSTDGGGEVGGPPPCTAATECPGQDSECKHRTCTAGVCGTANEATAKVLATQVIGDCRVRQCAADGTVATLIDDKDIPDDLNSCTKDVCTAGVASHAPLAKDTACGGGKLCNATGQCVGCNTAADCPGADTFCGTRTCVQNTCGVTFKAEGTKLVDSQSGDCKIQQCDGKGVIQTVASATDLPVDNNPCTQDQCNGTTPTHQPVARNTTCGAGQVCDGASHCVTCLTAASCPGTDTQCQSRTCVSGSCGMSFATAGKAVTGQVSGDCSKKQCNGTGMIVSVVDSTDPLVDNNPCTKDLCDNGQPSNPPLAARTNCGANLQCDGAGKCVTCLTTADCPGADTECQSRTCTAGTCGIAFKAAGTLVSNQTAGDCKQNQCDGKGVVTTVVDDGDTQNDNNPCTDDLCSGGTSSHPNKAAKVTCGTSLECDGAGHCVGCVADAECGTNTECVTFKCTSGTCGKTSTAAGTPVMAQTAKDCKKNQCDGAGNVATVVDDSDVPVDGFTCTMDVCMAGAPSNPALPLGTTCAQANGTMCNGTGSCVQCITAANCGTDTSGCKSFTCTVGVCGVVNAPSGSAPTNVDQTAGDCQKIVCNGSGARTSIDDNTDKPVDNKVCTDDLCTTGVPSNPPFGTNVTCNANGGTHCDGAGACVVCNVDAECVTPMDNFCLKHTCVNHVCSDTSSPPENTIVTTMQVADDCQDVICGGSHNITSRLNPTDDDDSNPCTTDSCNGDTPVHSPIAEGSACGNGKCNAAGRCDSCLHDSDCGMSTDCAAQVCNTSTGKCGTQLAPAGFVPQNGQTSGDCKKVQCDGAGNAAPVADPTDNDDGNSCTTDSCSGTNAVHMPVATGTSCTAATGPAMVCSASGVCVGCNTDADCGGTSPDGCTVNVCNTTDHICGRMDPGAGSLAISQTAQDCKKNVCDGNGNAVSANDDNDVFDDGNACTQNLCINGMRSNPPMTAGTTTCSQNGGTVCDKSAQCVPTFMTVRVGDSASTTALAAITAVVSVEEYTVSDGTLVRRITVPAAGATNAFTLGGSAGSEGGLALSGNGKFVTLAGYKTAAGNAGKTTDAPTVPRLVARIAADGSVDDSTSLAGVAFTKDNVRSAVTNDGLEFWTAGNGDKTANKGVFYTAPLGAAASSATNKLADSKSTRICQIAFGNLYCTGANTPLNNVFQIGTGLPTNSMANPMIFATTTLPGMPITDPAMPAVPPDPFGFAFIDTNNDQSADLLYVADDRRVIDGGGVQKWVLANGTWSLTGTTFSDAVNGSRGVAAYLSGSTVVIIASTAMDPPLPTGSPAISPVPPNAIIRFVDDQMTAPSMISPTTLITAGSDGMGAASNAFRGIALAPK